MAEPVFATVAELMAFVLDQPDELEKASSGGGGIVDAHEAALNFIEGTFSQGLRNQLQTDLGRLADNVRPGNVRSSIDNFLMPQFANSIGSVAKNPGVQYRDLFDYFETNSESLNSRDFTFAPIPAFTGTGDGTLTRITIDEFGHSMEGWFADTYTAKCTRDANQAGRQFEEQITIEGTELAPNELRRTGSGVGRVLTAQSIRNSERLVVNPGWDSFTGPAVVGSPASPLTLQGWTPAGSLTNLQIDLDLVYRDDPGQARSASLEFLADETITQNLITVRQASFSDDLPYLNRFAVYRKAGATGTLTVTLGAVSRVITIGTLANNAWTVLDLVATPGTDNWYRAFKLNDLSLSFAVTTLAVGTIHLDTNILVPFTKTGGTGNGRGTMGQYFVVTAGQVPFLRDDVTSFTDTEGGTRGVNQYWLAVADRGYLPSNNAGGETIPDK